MGDLPARSREKREIDAPDCAPLALLGPTSAESRPGYTELGSHEMCR